jgi:phage major head subunit gpT-like protein
MLINKANMDGLFQTFMTKFTDAQKAVAGRVTPKALILEEIAITMIVTGAATVHSWLEQIPGMKEWIGDRQVNNLKIGGVTVSNRDFEDTISVGRNSIEDDQYGIFAPLIGMMGQNAELIWPELAIGALTANGNWADGNPFFCSGRTLGDSTITNAVTTALVKAAVEAGLVAMQSFTLYSGKPAQVTPLYLVVGPSMESTANLICEAAMINDGNNVSVSNVSPATSLKVRVDPRLIGADAGKWYIIGTKGGLLPVCVQKRKLAKLTRMDKDDDENVFMRKEFLYGTDCRGESFLTLPFLAYAGGLSSVPAWAEVA